VTLVSVMLLCITFSLCFVWLFRFVVCFLPYPLFSAMFMGMFNSLLQFSIFNCSFLQFFYPFLIWLFYVYHDGMN
jgi:hypothetical protein